MRVFADRGFHAARVDDIVRSARTSHGTFYLYFTNKEDLLRALATECGLYGRLWRPEAKPLRWMGYAGLAILIALIGVFDGGQFIYFQF